MTAAAPQVQEIPTLAIPEPSEAEPKFKTGRSEVTTSRSVASRGFPTGRTEAMEAKVMGLIEKCLDKKVLEMQLKVPKVPQSQGLSARSGRSDRSGRSACSARTTTETVVSQLDQPGVPSHVETDTSVKAEPQPEAVTMAGKRAQAQKLSDASLGKFDDDQSRLAHLEMQKSAAEARNKNRSSLCFGYEPPSRTDEAAKVETMAGKRAQAQKLSDASLGKFDADQSRLAYLEMQKSAEEVRNKNRSANAFEKAEAPKYPALLREVPFVGPKRVNRNEAGICSSPSFARTIVHPDHCVITKQVWRGTLGNGQPSGNCYSI